MVHHALAEFLHHLVGRRDDAVEPVVQDDDPLLVVVALLVRVVDDQRGVQAAVLLDADVRVEPVGPGVREHELVGERAAWLDRLLRQVRHAVHVVAQCQAVPVHGGRVG
ncbi:Uncharacterised protein [Mycobacteroides abscessus subsp. abscessus]|nr:Uncharacterised protein [Mycobacteroides abscessus subsp. abscessus]